MWATEDVKRSAFKYLANVGKLNETCRPMRFNAF